MEAAAGTLGTLSQLADALRAAEVAVANAEAALNDVIRARDRIATVDIPEAMSAAGGITEFKFENGAKLVVKRDIKVSCTAENKAETYEWLRDHGHGGVIKSELRIGVGELTQVQVAKIAEVALKVGADTERTENVHPSTLKSLITELMEAGSPTPGSVTIFDYKKASIKEPPSRSR